MLIRHTTLAAPPTQFQKMRANRMALAENGRRKFLVEAEAEILQLKRRAWVWAQEMRALRYLSEAGQ